MARLTICGGGNATHVLISLASRAGWEVNVFTPLPGEAERLQAGMERNDGISVHWQGQVIKGWAGIVSADPAEVIPGSELILLALPAFAHGAILAAIAGVVTPGAFIGALPARGGFDFAARSRLAGRDVTLFGLQTLPWACRIITYGQQVDILGAKAEVDLAAWPPAAAPRLAERLGSLFQVPLNPVSSFLTLTLANTGQLIHPGIMYGICCGREMMVFERQEDIPFFYHGVDDPTARILEKMSDEVQALAVALPGFVRAEVLPLHAWLLRAYPTHISDGRSLLSAFTTNRAYAGLRLPVRAATPDTFAIDYANRYLAEDVPYGLVVVRGLAELAGIPTPTIDRVIDWAQARLDRCYLVDGRLAGPDLAGTHAPQAFGIHSLAELAGAVEQKMNSYPG